MEGNGSEVSAVTNQRHRGSTRGVLSALERTANPRSSVLNEEAFLAMLALERRRSDRSRKPFVLLLLELRLARINGDAASLIERLTTTLPKVTRETDIIGWYGKGQVLGVIFTEVNPEVGVSITEVLRSKVSIALRDSLNPKLISNISITAHLFPEEWNKRHPDRSADTKLYPDLSEGASNKQSRELLKRAMDISVSGILLLLLSPVLVMIAVSIKLTSKGGVLFAQDRLGQMATRFKCLKFRTMYVDNDPKIHREFVQSFIAGKSRPHGNNDSKASVYKITNDPRVTPVGRLLRKTSLDELPQLWNVFCGEMSLVGPRPPVPYEFEVYDFWHRRRVLEAKPGMTGLWQVSGRSRTCFDDMVRLDLLYSQKWSLWLDLRILLATPRAVFTGDGAV